MHREGTLRNTAENGAKNPLKVSARHSLFSFGGLERGGNSRAFAFDVGRAEVATASLATNVNVQDPEGVYEKAEKLDSISCAHPTRIFPSVGIYAHEALSSPSVRRNFNGRHCSN